MQGADAVDVDGTGLPVTADAANGLGHGRVVAVLVVAQERGVENDVVGGLDVGTGCCFVGGVEYEYCVLVVAE